MNRPPILMFSLRRMIWCLLGLAGMSALHSQVINPTPANPGPYQGPPFIQLIEAQTDGKVFVAGSFHLFTEGQDKMLIRLLPDGRLDESFDHASIPAGPYGPGVLSLLGLPEGKLLVGLNSSNGIVRLNQDGSLDESFQLEPLQDQSFYGYIAVSGMARLNDGKLMVHGAFSHIGTNEVSGIARLDADGRFDPSFRPQLSFEGRPVSAVAAVVQADGKIVLSGTFDAVNGIARDRLARIHADGTLDTSFQSNFSNSGWYTGIFDVRLDGRLVVRGPLGVNFLTADGALDYRVNPGLGISGTNRHLLGAKSLSRGTLIYGNFDTYDNQSRRSLARLNDDGSVDQSFDARLAKTSWAWSPTEITVRAVETLPDGSFLAAGSFTEVQGKAVTGLARFTADGKLDESFRPFEPTLHEAAITADGLYRFRVAGEFNRPYLVEVSEDLKTWQPLRNLMLTASPFYFVDPRQTSGHSFYRIRTL